MTPDPLDDVVDLREAAWLVNRSPVTLRGAVRRHELRARLVGTTWVTTREDLLRYLDDRAMRGRRRHASPTRSTGPVGASPTPPR